MSAIERPCGWRPDPEGVVPPYYRVMGASNPSSIPGAASMPYPEWDPQQIGNSCTGHTLAQMGYGMTGKKFSPYHSYYWGAVRDQGPRNLRDIGVSLSSVLLSASQHGLAEWEDWNPDSMGFASLTIPSAVARVRAQKYNVQIHRVYSDREGALCNALARGFSCGIVVRVDEGFDSTGPDGMVGPERGAQRGLHMITPWSYSTGRQGQRLVRCLCHWGKGFGDDGGVYLDRERIEVSPFVVYATRLS